MRFLLPFLLAFGVTTAFAAPDNAPEATASQELQDLPGYNDDSAWVPLFNGKDLDGWTPKFSGYELGENFRDTFRVENGNLMVSYDNWEDFNGEYGHLFYKDPGSYYVLRVEYRFIGEQVKGGAGWANRNNGLMLHGEAPEQMGKDQDYPSSLEFQLLGAFDQGERSNGNVCTPGTHVHMDGQLKTRHCISSTSESCRADEWVTVEAVVNGGKYLHHYVNGELVLEYQDPVLAKGDAHSAELIKENGGDASLSSGSISIQAESAPTEFRKIEVLPLKAEDFN